MNSAPMSALQFILTTAGKAAIVSANNTGTNPITIAKIGVGSASWTPTIAATALNTEIKKITTISGAVVADDTIHVTASDDSSDVYTVREIGLFTASDVLVAVYAQADPIITKSASTVALIAADLVITGIPAGSVTVGDAGFNYPQASETVKGVAEIATTSEAQAGTDNQRIITPAKLQTVTATETRRGVIELATSTEVQTGTDTVRAVTPAGLASLTATDARRGIVELATSAETFTGTDTERAVTPAGLASRTATETRSGIAEIATTAEVSGGTDDSRIVTPLKLAQRLLAVESYAQATETSLGLVELATTSEAQAGTDTERAVTPAGLASRTATTDRAGIVELATVGEVLAGTDTVRAVTPAGLAALESSSTRRGLIEIATATEVLDGVNSEAAVTPLTLSALTASTSRRGLVELATTSETITGTDTERAVTPNGLRLSPFASRAWVNFRGSSTVAINNSHNVTSITDLGVGLYQINWDVDFGSSDYAWVGTARMDGDGSAENAVVTAQASQTKSISALRIRVTYDEGSAQDSPEISVVTFT